MDPNQNLYSPGAGTPPPELAGRDDIFEQARIAMERLRRGRSARGILMVGLRGVGKTGLLEKIHENAVSKELCALRIEAPEERSLPALLASQLRITLLKLSQVERVKDMVGKGFQALAGFRLSLVDLYF